MEPQKLRLLYVEDNPADADLARCELARLTPRVQLDIVATVTAARDALAAKAPPFDVILADLRLPDGSGLELLAHVRARELPIAVVIITGLGDQEAAVAALKAGADDYLVKQPENFRHLPHILLAARERFLAAQTRWATPLRVLYAEPNPFDSDLTRRHFTQHVPHIQLTVVNNGEDVLARLLPAPANGAADIDVLLLDYRLPGMNALEVVKKLRQERKSRIPIVLVTGQGTEEVAVQALRLGVDDYLVKRDDYLQRLPAVLENVRKQAELSRAEARYRNLFTGQRDVIVVADLSRIIIDANQPALRTLFGYETDEILGRSTSMLYADTEQFQLTGHEVFNRRNSGPGKLLEACFRRKTGEIFVGEIFALKLLNDQGEITGNIGVIRDVTERHRAEQERQKLIVELEKRNAELERFTYTVSHDLKSPLVTILGFTGQLEQDLRDQATDNIADDLAFIREAAGQMSELLDSLLKLSRAGRTIGDPRPVDLAALAREAVGQAGERLAHARPRIDIPSDLPVLMGDPLRLREVFQNLLDNAVKFTLGGAEPEIEVGCRVDTGEVLCFVRDNGIGVAPEYQARIFGLFEQLDPRMEGSGIGLAIVRRIVEEHGGRIWVESAGEGQGSTFYFTLPL